jgi:signal transduction histidine kinase
MTSESPKTVAPAGATLDDLEFWRRRVFHFVLYLTLGFGFPPLAAWSVTKLEQGRLTAMLPMWGFYAFLVALALARKAPFRPRAAIFLGCLFAAGSIAILEYGFRGQGPFMYLAVVTMTVVFLGFRAAVIVFVVAMLMLLATAFGFLRELLHDNAMHSLTSMAPWISLLATFLMVGTSMLAAVGVLMRRLETGLATERGLVKDLRREVDTAETARAEALRELGERKRAEERLEQRDRVLHAVGFAAEKLLLSRRWEDCAEEVLRAIGEAAGVERVTLTELVADLKWGDRKELRFQWKRPSSRVAGRDDTATPVIATVLPLSVDGKPWGFIGLESSDPSLEIPEQVIDLLRAAAGSLGAAVGRDRLNAELEARVTERTERLARANEEVEAFSFTISHDLRAPLRHVSAYVGMLRDENDGVLSDKALARMTVIADAAERMTRMIDDLLQFYRLGRSSFASTELDLGKIVAEVIAEHEHETRSRDVAWRVGSLPELRADRALMKHVFSNLIGNALKYTSSRPHAEIAVGHEASEREVIVYVRDNGVGFDPSQEHRLFHVFQRLHPLHDFEGNGVGLAHVRRIVERHGGRVWAKGAVDAGATFYLALPVSSRPG